MNCQGVKPLSTPVSTAPTAPARPSGSPDTPAPAQAAPPSDSVAISASPAPATVSATSSVATGLASVGALCATAGTTALQAAASSIGGAIGKKLSALASGLRFVYYGSLYKLEEGITAVREKIYKPLEGLPAPTIQVPFVLVPGWTTQPEAFGPLTDFLTQNGTNGGKAYFVKLGGFYEMDASGTLQPVAQVPRDAKVFEMVFTDPHQSPDKNQSEMRQNFDAIQQATGAPQVDVEGFSMGGIDSRLYIDQGGKAIRRLLTLGTPHRGTEFANMVTTLFEKDVQWAQKFGGITDRDRDSIKWLRSESNNPDLADLNSRWDDQRKAVPTLSLGSDLMPTPSYRSVIGLATGDGLVERYSLELPRSDTIVLHQAMQHGRLNDDEVVQHVRSVFFGWTLAKNAAKDFPDDAEIIAKVPRPANPPAQPGAQTTPAP